MGKTILIVEDEQNIVDILSFNLEQEGYDTLEAYDGPTGLQLALEQNPDLILLDPEAEKVYPKYYPCTVEVTMKDGSLVTAHVDYPKGDPENPVTWDEAVEKFRFMSGHHIGSVEQDRIIELVANLEKLEHISELMELLY